MSDLGKLLSFFGAVLAGVGILLTLVGKVPWIGRLPGDIRIGGQNGSIFIPLATCLLISALLTIALNLLVRH